MSFSEIIQRFKKVFARPDQFPKERIKHRWSGKEYVSEVERVFNEGSASCHHEWQRIPRSQWDVHKYGPIGGTETNGLWQNVEIKRRAYLCSKCEAECLILFSHVHDED